MKFVINNRILNEFKLIIVFLLYKFLLLVVIMEMERSWNDKIDNGNCVGFVEMMKLEMERLNVVCSEVKVMKLMMEIVVVPVVVVAAVEIGCDWLIVVGNGEVGMIDWCITTPSTVEVTESDLKLKQLVMSAWQFPGENHRRWGREWKIMEIRM